ncbi:uncharacterized protein LOC114359520, partial [Ostrinia furnacalis]|uniref:uncharacterized protein LOC114359520 n=1 Tax=Ostrinia furnacalis TaxID=93504 RepID=UPI00104002B2
MNGLMLRINPSNNKNISSIKFGPIELSYHVNTEPDHDLVKKFIDSKTSEEQFGVVRSLLDANLEAVDNNLLRFLAIVFVEAEIKHPIKSFIIRSITKSQTLQDPFSEKLAIVLSYIITQEYREFQEYYDATFDIEGCIANFPAGRRAFKMIDLDLAKFLKRSLRCCVNTLRERNLAPTQKNELFEVTQRTLRLAFHIMQHVRPGYMDSLFEELRRDIKYLLFHQETPMDTKNVGGLLIYSMHILENGEDAWLQILYPPQGDDYLSDVLENESARLALLTAAIILTNTERLLAPADDEEPILTLAERVIAIGEKGSSECIIVLGVARAVEMTSKKLDKIADPQLGLELVDILLGFTRAHLTHYMDSVRHLSVKSLASMVTY